MIAWLAEFGRMLNDWLHQVPTTQFKILVGALLAFMVVLFYFAMEWFQKAIDIVAFGMALGFIASWAALAYRQYKAKRETDYGYLERKSQQIPKPPEAQ